MSLPICVTCGVQYGAPRDDCPVCEDARQYVPVDGQQWTTLEELRPSHTQRDPARGRADRRSAPSRSSRSASARCSSRTATRNVLWDCVTLLDDATAAEIEAPRRADGDRDLAPALLLDDGRMGAPLRRARCWLHEADREWVMRDDPAIEYWSGETYDLGDGLTLIRCGGHFAGGTVLHRAGATCSSATSSRSSRTAAGSRSCTAIPNLIPLPEASIRAIAAALEPYAFERIYGAWWGTVIPADGKRHRAPLRAALYRRPARETAMK